MVAGSLLIARFKGDARAKDHQAAHAAGLKTKPAQNAFATHAELAKPFTMPFGGGSKLGVVPDKRELVTSPTALLPATARAGANLADSAAAGR